MKFRALAAAAATVASCCAVPAAAQASATTAQPAGVHQSGTLPTVPPYHLDYTLTPGAKLGPGLIFIDPHKTVPSSAKTATEGPEIITTSGKVVWYDPLRGARSASNFQVQRYQGKPVLTWWQGTGGNPAFGALSVGIGQGEDVIMNSNYKIIKIIHGVNGYRPDTHEFYLTRSGDALVTAYKNVKDVDLTSVGGSADGTVVNSYVREIDIKTGKVLLNWSALAHVPITDSYALPLLGDSPWDYFHVNSISPAPDGNLLVSSRHTWALYEINPHTGAVVWTLGGKSSSFKVAAKAQFAWQHDPRFISKDEIQLFDDQDGTPYGANESASRALWITLNTKAMTASLAKQIVQPQTQAQTGSQGSVQTLANGNVLVGWGQAGSFSEYNSRGRMLMYAMLPGGGLTTVAGHTVENNWQTYRVFQEQWTGTPATRPVVRSVATRSGLRISAGWNGATRARAWRIFAGSARSHLEAVKTVAWTGLITTTSLAGADARYVRVQALGAAGQVLRASAIIATS